MKAQSLADLRALLKPKAERSTISFSLIQDGVPLGGIIQVMGQGKSELVTLFLAEQPSLRCCWIEQSFSINPSAITSFGVSLARILFIEGGKQTMWATLQALRSGAFHVVVAYLDEIKVDDQRRLQLAAEKSESIIFWLSSEKSLGAWPILMKTQVRKFNDELSVDILSRKS